MLVYIHLLLQINVSLLKLSETEQLLYYVCLCMVCVQYIHYCRKSCLWLFQSCWMTGGGVGGGDHWFATQ